MHPKESHFQTPCPVCKCAGKFSVRGAISIYILTLCLLLWPAAGMTQISGFVIGLAQILSRGSENPGSNTEKAGDSNLGVYAIPASNVLSIHLNDASVIDALSLRDHAGTTIYQEGFKIPVHVAQLNLKARPAGEYILQVRSGDRLFSKRVVKE